MISNTWLGGTRTRATTCACACVSAVPSSPSTLAGGRLSVAKSKVNTSAVCQTLTKSAKTPGILSSGIETRICGGWLMPLTIVGPGRPARPTPRGTTVLRQTRRWVWSADVTQYPSAPRTDHADVLHGITVPDPYRTLEDESDPETVG